jgi:hypothetical protein
MTLNVNEPSDTRLISELASYIRENRAAISAIVGSDNFGSSTLEVAAGAVSLSVGTELSSDGIETVVISGAGLADIARILGGTDGQIKIFIFQDANIDFVDSISKANGTFYLNHLPAGSDFSPTQDDIIAIRNIGGDGALTYGYWKELFRTLSVK